MRDILLFQGLFAGLSTLACLTWQSWFFLCDSLLDILNADYYLVLMIMDLVRIPGASLVHHQRITISFGRKILSIKTHFFGSYRVFFDVFLFGYKAQLNKDQLFVH